MPSYKIEQTATAVILWEGEAASKEAALDAMAQEAGYRDYADCVEQTGEDDGVVVREVEAEEPGESHRIPAHELLTKAQRTATTFNDEFPNERPEVAWLVEAAAIERIPDEQRDEWTQAFSKTLQSLRVSP